MTTMGLPEALIDGEWPIADDIALLQRVQAAHTELDERVRTMTQDLAASRLYPRKTDSKELRIRVSHTYAPPSPTASEDSPSAPGRWTLRIEAMDAKLGTPASFSTYFRKATIELDPRVYADSIIEWTSFQKAHHEVDALEITRSGQTTHTLRIKLLPTHMPERYAISEALAAVAGASLSGAAAFTKQNIVMAVWEYIKRQDRIKEDDCRMVVCDAALARLFACELLPFSSVVSALKTHLTPVHSVDLEYTLRLSADASSADSEAPASAGAAAAVVGEELVDVDVGAVDTLERVKARVLAEWEELAQEQQKDLALLKQQESDLVERLHEQCRRREWMQQFALDPVGFMKDVAQSQQADEQILVAEAETDEINVPHPHQFSQPWVREVVSSLLTTPAAK
ncbi:hypothetical protein PybrP1_009135 [[Pythium] brassicae (nom. inval.)]|nr:hypothetical protein PybrP1_009135 [[Pythium] brassicae (nom. inval.)]